MAEHTHGSYGHAHEGGDVPHAHDEPAVVEEPEPVEMVLPDEGDEVSIAAIEAMAATSVAAIEAVRDVAETEALTDMVTDLAEEEGDAEDAGEDAGEAEEAHDDEGDETEEAPPAQSVTVPPQLKDDQPAPRSQTHTVSRFRAHRR